jgi:hypothetical protein
MKVVICPGIHSAELTEGFVSGLHDSIQPHDRVIFPTEKSPAYSPLHVLELLNSPTPYLFIAFSAGVVGAIGAARLWQKQGGTVKALIALDGWGVPLEANFPIHRVSHDFFTHWSSRLLGKGLDSFYADPAVAHLDLWRSPQTVSGCWIKSVPQKGLLEEHPALSSPRPPVSSSPITLATFITALLQKYGAETQADTES